MVSDGLVESKEFLQVIEEEEIPQSSRNDEYVGGLDLLDDMEAREAATVRSQVDERPLMIFNLGGVEQTDSGDPELEPLPEKETDVDKADDWIEYEKETRELLEDFRCPICLETLINTVKVDCSYGHKFCNFCINRWFLYGHNLSLECPVCRSPIRRKILDKMVDTEVNSRFEHFSEKVRRTRMIAVKERAGLEQADIPRNDYEDFVIDFPITPCPTIREEFDRTVGRPPRQNHHYQQMQRPRLHLQSWNTFQAPSQPTIALVWNLETAETPSEIRYQHYQYKNQETRWDNHLYLTPEEISEPACANS